MWTKGTVIPQKHVILPIRWITNCLFLRYEKSNVGHNLFGFLSWSVLSLSLSPIFESNEQDNMQVTNNIPAMAINVILHELTVNKAWMMGLITINPPPHPIRTSPVANERLLMKYLGIIVSTTKKIQQFPKPNATPNVKYIRVRFGACEVARRAMVEIIPPAIPTVRWLNRSQRSPTTGPNRLPHAYAREPTQAGRTDKKKTTTNRKQRSRRAQALSPDRNPW